MPIDHIPMKEKVEHIEKRKKGNANFILSDPLYSFKDVILPDEIIDEIEEVIALSRYRNLIFNEWGLGKVIKRNRNISINLYGDSGTGKTMTAHAIAETLNKKILLVKYSEVESKYVGETSKNLVSLFETAQESDAIIIFDEADALLSKRVTMMNNATDVSVNQTRNVLLKLLDEYIGIVIFTTNFIQNFDFAFMRRILCHIKFENPNEEVRKKLWEHYLVEKLPLKDNRAGLIEYLCKVEDLTGSDISTIVLKSAIKAAQKGIFEVDINSINTEINKVKSTKMRMNNGGISITTRKVSEEYVKEKLNNGGIIDGCDK